MSRNPFEQELRDQVDFLMSQLRAGSIDIHEFMQLLDMAYGDFLDFHPEERPGLNERKQYDEQY